MLDNLREDTRRFKRFTGRSTLRLIFLDQGYWAMICYRFGRHLVDHRLPPGLHQFVQLFYQLWFKHIQIITGISIAPSVRIGPGFYIGHFGQIFLGADTVIGRECNISHGVTLGFAWHDGKWGVPTVGDRVYIATGAKVIGPIHLADGTVVGANAVVTRSTEPNAVVAGIPARVLNYNGSARYID